MISNLYIQYILITYRPRDRTYSGSVSYIALCPCERSFSIIYWVYIIIHIIIIWKLIYLTYALSDFNKYIHRVNIYIYKCQDTFIIWIDMIFDPIRRTDNHVLNSEHCALMNSSVLFAIHICKKKKIKKILKKGGVGNITACILFFLKF